MAVMRNIPRSLVVILAFVSIVGVALLDMVVSAQLALSVYFLIPILLINHYAGRWVGIGACVASAVSWLLADLSKPSPSYGSSLVLYWNACGRLGVFLLVAMLWQRVKAHTGSLEQAVQERTASLKAEIEERMRAEAIVRDMQRAAARRERLADIGTIAAKVAHDLGNPLAGLSMQAQLLVRRAHQDGNQPLKTVVKVAEQILAETRRIDSLLLEFKDFAREQRLNLKPISLTAFLRQLAGLWQPMASARHIALVLRIPEGDHWLVADEDKLWRVFDNLVKNAVEAIDAGPGQVSIGLQPLPPETVDISVEDTGCGIPETVEVFRLFETTKADGSGLGLPIVKQIVVAHGGSIEFGAAQPHGTVFHIKLPRYMPAA